MTLVWVDYNSLNERDETSAGREHCDGPVTVLDRVMTYDGEGNECPGVVIGMYFNRARRVARVRIDRAAFVATDPGDDETPPPDPKV